MIWPYREALDSKIVVKIISVILTNKNLYYFLGGGVFKVVVLNLPNAATH